jgi:hypothetical protein
MFRRFCSFDSKTTGFGRQQLSMTALGLGLLATVGCENYTTAALCTTDNQIDSLPGASGRYSMSLQDQEFNVESQDFDITVSEGKVTLSPLAPSTFETPQESVLCAWSNGWIVSQTKNQESNLYSYTRVAVTNLGYTSSKIFFDRNKLTEAGVPSSVKPIPRQTSVTQFAEGIAQHANILTGSLLGAESDGDTHPSLVIENNAVDAEQIVRAAHTSLVGVTLLRR